jgi:hypothetical protein
VTEETVSAMIELLQSSRTVATADEGAPQGLARLIHRLEQGILVADLDAFQGLGERLAYIAGLAPRVSLPPEPLEADLDRCEVHRYTPADAMRPAASACRSMTAEDKVVHVLRMWTHYA